MNTDSLPALPTAVWRKSSYSTGTGNCVEIALAWRKSSYSSANGQCVEVAYATATVAVRDSKNPTGPVLSVAAFAAFVRDVKSGRINY
jgi:hypothetical protein